MNKKQNFDTTLAVVVSVLVSVVYLFIFVLDAVDTKTFVPTQHSSSNRGASVVMFQQTAATSSSTAASPTTSTSADSGGGTTSQDPQSSTNANKDYKQMKIDLTLIVDDANKGRYSTPEEAGAAIASNICANTVKFIDRLTQDISTEATRLGHKSSTGSGKYSSAGVTCSANKVMTVLNVEGPEAQNAVQEILNNLAASSSSASSTSWLATQTLPQINTDYGGAAAGGASVSAVKAAPGNPPAAPPADPPIGAIISSLKEKSEQ